jgi:hypothetical protein
VRFLSLLGSALALLAAERKECAAGVGWGRAFSFHYSRAACFCTAGFLNTFFAGCLLAYCCGFLFLGAAPILLLLFFFRDLNPRNNYCGLVQNIYFKSSFQKSSNPPSEFAL